MLQERSYVFFRKSKFNLWIHINRVKSTVVHNFNATTIKIYDIIDIYE